MHLVLLTTLFAAVASKASTPAKASAGGSSFFLIVLLALAVLYFFVLRPRQRKARQQQGGRSNLEVGDEVISAGGILGRIVAIDGDEIVVEVGPGTTMTFWRRAVNLRSSVAGAPPGATMAPPTPPEEPVDDHYGIDHRYDDGEDGTGSEPSGHFGTPEETSDGAAAAADGGPAQPIYDPGAQPSSDPWGTAPQGEGTESSGSPEGR